MADFENLALQYVVLDDQAAMQDLASQAAKAIEDVGASRIAVGNWAASIRLWIHPSLDKKDATDGNDDESGNAITRAKAIGFLAATLEVLNKDLLKTDQVELLVGFFGSMFSNDHKAGITPSATALHQLITARNFKPEMGVKIIEDVSKMKDDFRLQTAATRLEVYQLLLSLIQNSAVAGELQHKYGASSGFILELLHLCQNERDPKNLIIWFKIVKILLSEYSPSPEVTDEIFKVFSNYFPITIRESTSPIGVTPEDLKGALRECFSAHHRLARLAFPYLLQRLDQGDSMKVTVKTDILMTLKSCIEKYENPQSSLTPYITPIWNSLKYEVRNGEVTETVDGAISVLRAIAAKLQSDSSQLDEYVNTVFRDTLDDLSEQTYVEQAGKMCLAVVSSGPRAFVSHSSKFLDSVKQNIQQAKSVTHTRDLLEVLHFLLEARQALTKVHNDDGELLSRDAATPFDSLFHKVYLPLWQKHITQAEGVNVGVLKAVTSGVAMLLVQEVALTGGKRSLLCSDELCSEITSLFTHRLLMPLTLSPKDAAAMAVDADIGLQEALSTIVSTYMDGFATVVASTKAAILSQNWKFTKQQQSIKRLWQITCQVSFIGCSKLPQGVALSSSAEKKYSPLHHFLTWTGALLQLTESLLTKQADPPVIRHMTAAIQHSICSFRDACGSSSKQVSLHADGDSPSDWAEEVRQAIAGADIPSDWLSLLSSQYFDIYDKVVLKFKDEGQIPASGSGDVYADFTRLSLFIVRHLYRRFTKESPTENGQTMLQVADGLFYTEGQLTAVIDQIAKIATLTIQTLDAPSQRFYNLSTEAFQLFRQREVAPPYWSVDRDSFGVLNLLTIGILSGLWPDAMVDLYKPDGIALSVLCNDVYNRGLDSIEAPMIAVLANKYQPSPSTFTFKQVVQFWRDRIVQDLPSWNPPTQVMLTFDIGRVLDILIGAARRQEKEVLGLIPFVHKLLGIPDFPGDAVAEEMGRLIGEEEVLQSEGHAVIKPLYRQWVYAHVVKPMYEHAFPIKSDASEAVTTAAERHTAAILLMLKHCPFAVYEPDTDRLVSMILVVLKTMHEGEFTRLALGLLHEIMRNDHKALRYHIRAIIDALTEVYKAHLGPPKATAGTENKELEHIAASKKDKRPLSKAAACRREALEMLGDMAELFEDRYIMPFRGTMNQFLNSCCGDPVRELRWIAHQSRDKWFGL